MNACTRRLAASTGVRAAPPSVLALAAVTPEAAGSDQAPNQASARRVKTDVVTVDWSR